jgi:hypothetical protein
MAREPSKELSEREAPASLSSVPGVGSTSYLAWMYRAFLFLVSQLVGVQPAGHRRPTAPRGNGTKVRHSLFVGLVAAFAVSLASVAVSAVAAQTPFKGAVKAVETSQVVFPTAFLDGTGTGTATYLGRYTERVILKINIPTMSSTGTATFTAANGDTLSASVVGQATRTGPTVLSIVEVYTITGGTGRFADATGTFTLASTLEQTTGVSTGTFSGAIDH